MMGRYAQIVDCDRCMAARHGTVDRIEHALDADCRVGKVDEEHASAVIGPGHDDADLRALRAGNERLAAVDHPMVAVRSEEHTSELQSLMRISFAVFCLKTKTHKIQEYLNTLMINP